MLKSYLSQHWLDDTLGCVSRDDKGYLDDQVSDPNLGGISVCFWAECILEFRYLTTCEVCMFSSGVDID